MKPVNSQYTHLKMYFKTKMFQYREIRSVVFTINHAHVYVLIADLDVITILHLYIMYELLDSTNFTSLAFFI